MDRLFNTQLGRTIRIKANEQTHEVFIQIRDHTGKELASAVLNSGELQQLFNLVNEATAIID